MRAALVAALAAASLPSALGGAFWEDPSYAASLGLSSPSPSPAPSPSPSAMRFREARPSEDMVAERRRGPSRHPGASIADRVRDASAHPSMWSDVPSGGVEPPMAYGDREGAFARFREMAEAAGKYRAESAAEGPFGGASRHAPAVAAVDRTGSRFESPAFAEVVSQLKDIVRDPKGRAAAEKASTKHLLSSVVSAPGRAPPLAPAPPGGLASGPPIPMPAPILTPIDAKPAAPAPAPAAPAKDERKPKFLLETAADAYEAPAPQPKRREAGASLVETQARVQDPTERLQHLATLHGPEPPARLPVMKPLEMDEELRNNPYVRYD